MLSEWLLDGVGRMSDKDGGRLKNYCKEDYNISFHRVDLFFGGCQPLLLITACAWTIFSTATLSLHQFFTAVVCIQNLPDEGQGQVAALRMEWMEVGRAKNFHKTTKWDTYRKLLEKPSFKNTAKWWKCIQRGFMTHRLKKLEFRLHYWTKSI